MARGWESKSVEAQQEESARARVSGPTMTDTQRESTQQRRALELARAAATDDLRRATAPAHRKMLEQKLAAIEAQLERLESPKP